MIKNFDIYTPFEYIPLGDSKKPWKKQEITKGDYPDQLIMPGKRYPHRVRVKVSIKKIFNMYGEYKQASVYLPSAVRDYLELTDKDVLMLEIVKVQE